MKRVAYWCQVVTICFLLMLSEAAASGVGPISEGRTLSPYFFVNSGDGETDSLPLKSTSASVRISGVIADVVVTQVYRNAGRKPLEAIYVFPGSTHAAVYGMTMTIGKRVIEAEIKKRDEARREYEQARDAGKNASLLEQQRPNVFEMNVANIMPGDEIKVELKYTELLIPTDHVYEFVYPAVVGPRYSNQKASAASRSERWVENPYLRQDELPATAFDVAIRINAGMPIAGLTCTSHKVKASYNGDSQVAVYLDKSERHGGNRDYILRYRLDGNTVQTGLLLFQGQNENFFVMMMQPPKYIRQAEIPGREYIFIVDVSGSMYGFPLDTSKKLLTDLIGKLRPTDKFNILLFSGGSSVMAEESLPANAENVRRAVTLIERQRGGGGTELLPALKRALALKKAEGVSRTVVVVTDGYVTVEEEAFDLIRRRLGDANMFAFGIGAGVNRHLIEGMARVGMGEPFIITNPEAAPAQAERFRKMIEAPMLTKIRVTYSGFAAYDVEPVAIPDVLSDRPILVFGKWSGKPEGTITVNGWTGKGKYSQTIKVENYKPVKDNAALKYLWARHRITQLSDYNMLRSDDERIKEITGLGLKYRLLTAYTSFVAVDNQVRNNDGKLTVVKQPLPLPQGVSNYAVGGAQPYSVAPAMKTARLMTTDSMKVESLAKEFKPGLEEEKAKLRIEKIVVAKGLSEADVLDAVKQHLDDIEQCLAGNGFAGRLLINVVIDRDGKAENVSIKIEGKQWREKHRQCIEEKIMTWRFVPSKTRDAIKAIIILQR